MELKPGLGSSRQPHSGRSRTRDVRVEGGGSLLISIVWMTFCFVSAAWVHRGFSDDVTEVRTIQPGGDLLTDFQKDKFRYFFFHVLDLNADCVISAEDFQKLNEASLGRRTFRKWTWHRRQKSGFFLRSGKNPAFVPNPKRTRQTRARVLVKLPRIYILGIAPLTRGGSSRAISGQPWMRPDSHKLLSCYNWIWLDQGFDQVQSFR